MLAIKKGGNITIGHYINKTCNLNWYKQLRKHWRGRPGQGKTNSRVLCLLTTNNLCL